MVMVERTFFGCNLCPGVWVKSLIEGEGVCTQRNFVESTPNQIVFSIFRLILIQTDVRLVPNQSESGKYNLILGRFNKIPKIFLCLKRGSGCFWLTSVREASTSSGTGGGGELRKHPSTILL